MEVIYLDSNIMVLEMYISRNMALSVLNLSFNDLVDSSKDLIERLANNTKDSFTLLLNYNKFDEKTRERFKKSYKKKILI